MNKVIGIKSVDFRVLAFGYGVVNWNGTTSLISDGKKKVVDNHTLPKLRGYTNFSDEENENGYTLKKVSDGIDFKKNKLYISQNCIRHHLFREQSYDRATDDNLDRILASITGLIRGYVVPSSQLKRASPLLITDFVDKLGKGNFEQFSSASASKKKSSNNKSTNSFFSKTTFGDTEYEAFGSISIEQLQFIVLDSKFDRAAMNVSEESGKEIALKIQRFIKSLDPDRDPRAVFHKNYVRKGSISDEGEAGILLDNTSIDILVEETLKRIEELSIKQAKGYMYVESVNRDYNDSNKMMRIKRSNCGSQIIDKRPNKCEYAVYFEAK